MPFRLSTLLLAMLMMSSPADAQSGIVRYVRYAVQGHASYGILDGDGIRQLRAAPWIDATPTGQRVTVKSVTMLAPSEPSKVLAVGLNYQTHLGERPAAAYPGLFAKLPTAIIATEENIVLPPDATNTHYEGEMVIVIGKKASRVSKENAKEYVFGVTVGNDVSEREWQKNDLQWLRAKASDTFGPLGPAIVTGVDYDDLLLQTRLNGEVVQSQRTKDLIFNVAEIVSYISQYVTLMPGDVIYSGTPGATRAIKAGDVVEVELQNVGVLRNKVTQAGR
jgi:2-keto-4-pentenoate hydratase/2-oxohepta-3-ene-1,7-dioic acid hydratase in catechol pathway